MRHGGERGRPSVCRGSIARVYPARDWPGAAAGRQMKAEEDAGRELINEDQRVLELADLHSSRACGGLPDSGAEGFSAARPVTPQAGNRTTDSSAETHRSLYPATSTDLFSAAGA